MSKETEPGYPGQDFRFLDAVLARAQKAMRAGNSLRAGKLFSRCITELEPGLVRAAHAKCGDLQMAEDAFQNTCLYIFKRLGTPDVPDVSAYGQFKTVMSCRLTDLYRKQNPKSIKFTPWSDISRGGDDYPEFDPEDPRYSSDELARAEKSSRYAQILEMFVATLSTFDRNLLRFRRDGLSYAEIQREMPTDCPVKTLSKRTRRLIRDYRRYLDNENNL